MKHRAFPDTHHDVSSNTIFGFWVYLMTDSVMFASFFAAYAVLRQNTFGGPTAKDVLHPQLALVETILLLFSSYTCGMALTHAPDGRIRKTVGWFALTFLLGAGFLSMQFFEFQELIYRGITWDKSAFLSSYYALIGTHSLHIVIGLLFMIFFVFQLVSRKNDPVVLRRLTCFRIYWQFLYFIWIFTFAFVYLM